MNDPTTYDRIAMACVALAPRRSRGDDRVCLERMVPPVNVKDWTMRGHLHHPYEAVTFTCPCGRYTITFNTTPINDGAPEEPPTLGKVESILADAAHVCQEVDR